MFERAIFRHHEEDDLVFAYLGGIDSGVFVEVGANDPEDGSQTLRLEKAGWSGLLVEPLSEHAEDLRRLRKAHVEEVACGPRSQHDTVMRFKVAGVASTLADDFLDVKVEEAESRSVRVVTLDFLLEKHDIDRIDFLSLDVEGYEMEVLDGLSLDRYRPAFILIEDRIRDLKRHRHLVDHGYRLVRRSGANGWYVPAETPFPVSPYGRWQLFWKYRVKQPFRGAYDRLRRRLRNRHQSS